MRAFVTGAGGFLGSHLVELLVSRGYDVTAFLFDNAPLNNLDPSLQVVRMYGDVRNFSDVKNAMKGCDVVFHLAACMNSPNATYQDFFSTNVKGARNVMQAALDLKVKRVVHTSSLVTLKENVKRVDESSLHSGFFDGSYSQTKFLGEKVVMEFGARGLPVVVVNPTLVYGPRGLALTGFFRLHVEPRIRFASFMNCILNMIYVKDAVLGHLLALEKGKLGHKYILGGKEVLLGDFLNVLDAVSGKKKPTIVLPEVLLESGSRILSPLFALFGKSFPVPKPQIDAMKRGSSADISKMLNEFNLPLTPLEVGLAETIAWCREKKLVK